MSSVIQSPCTLSEAETKKGCCSVSDNGLLTFPRLLDVVADAALVDGTRFVGSRISEVWGKGETSEHNQILPINPRSRKGKTGA